MPPYSAELEPAAAAPAHTDYNDPFAEFPANHDLKLIAIDEGSIAATAESQQEELALVPSPSLDSQDSDDSQDSQDSYASNVLDRILDFNPCAMNNMASAGVTKANDKAIESGYGCSMSPPGLVAFKSRKCAECGQECSVLKGYKKEISLEKSFDAALFDEDKSVKSLWSKTKKNKIYYHKGCYQIKQYRDEHREKSGFKSVMKELLDHFAAMELEAEQQTAIDEEEVRYTVAKAAIEEAERKAEEERRALEEEEARRAVAAAKAKAEAEAAAKMKAEEEEKERLALEAKKKAEEEAARAKVEAEKKAEEEEKERLELEAKKKAEEEEKERLELEAKKQAEEEKKRLELEAMEKAEEEEKERLELETKEKAEEEEKKEHVLEERDGRRASLIELEVERKTEEGHAEADTAIEWEATPIAEEGQRGLGEEEVRGAETGDKKAKKKKSKFLKRVKKALSCKGKKATVDAVETGKWQKYYDADHKRHYYSDGVRTSWTKPEQMPDEN